MENKILPGGEAIRVKGNGFGVLMLHGFSSSPYEMKFLAKSLSNNGYYIEVPILRGHSTTPDDLKNTIWTDWFGDAKKALFALRKNCKKIVVVGLSTGASLALHLAAHYQVEGVVALSPAIMLQSKKLKLLPLISPFKKYHYKKDGPDILDKEQRNLSVGYNKIPVKSIKQLLKFYNHVKDDLPDVYVPLLLMHSKKDHVIDLRGVRYIHDTVSSSHKIMLELQKSFHVITLDVEKEIVFREVNKFIEDIFR